MPSLQHARKFGLAVACASVLPRLPEGEAGCKEASFFQRWKTVSKRWTTSTSRASSVKIGVHCEAPTKYEDITWSSLKDQLKALPKDEQRAALSLLGLALGDAAGLPFELRRGKENRAAYHATASEHKREELAKGLVLKRAQAKPETVFVRTYSDDTSCCDLKMSAAAQVTVKEGTSTADELRLSVLQQYLKWAHSSKPKPSTGLDKPGPLFQGTGGFTQDFLVPKRKNEVAREMGSEPLYGDNFWPTVHFAAFAKDYFAGKHSFPSWGNGAVMSFAPHPVLAGRWRRGQSAVPEELQEAACVMSLSHQEPTALLASNLMWSLLDKIYDGSIKTTDDIRRNLPSLEGAFDLFAATGHECIPLEPFWQWLERGDCTPEVAEKFLKGLGMDSDHDWESTPHGVFGKLLHIAADWNDDKETRLKRPNSKEPVLFSQRGLNSLIIAIWAASESTSPWEVISKVLYVGGDTDTIGAVAGQVACPLLDPEEVVAAYQSFVALDIPEGATKEPKLDVASAAARRYFQRALLFAAGKLSELKSTPSLLDVPYPPYTANLVKTTVLKDFEE